jgi:hypothetical protein
MTSVRWPISMRRTRFSWGRLACLFTKGAKRSYFDRLAKSGDKVSINNRKIVVLDGNVAYVTGFYEFKATRNGETRKSPAGFTMVLVKRGNDWLIAHHHSSRRSLAPLTLPLRRG